jgi:hypothetical protein
MAERTCAAPVAAFAARCTSCKMGVPSRRDETASWRNCVAGGSALWLGEEGGALKVASAIHLSCTAMLSCGEDLKKLARVGGPVFSQGWNSRSRGSSALSELFCHGPSNMSHIGSKV